MRVAGAAGRGLSWSPSCWSRPRRRGRRRCAARGSCCWAVLRGTLGLPRYGEPVTASWSFDGQPRSGHPLLSDAAAAIRDALLPEDRQAFEATYQDALSRAREDLDPTELFKSDAQASARHPLRLYEGGAAGGGGRDG
jgi:Family of unknown function (DUF6247)